MATVTGARVVVCERWSVLRRGLVDVLEGVHRVVEEVAAVAELVDVVRTRPVELAIIGHETGLDAVALLTSLAELRTAPPVLVLSDDVDAERLRGLLKAGALGVLSKRVDDDALLDAVARVLAGDRVIDQCYLPLLFGAAAEAELAPRDDSPLTARELEVLRILARSATNREIAEALTIGEATVKTHLGRIYAKLEVSGRHQAVGRAFELGLLG